MSVIPAAVLLLVMIAGALGVPPVAAAAEYFAHPTGSGTTCSSGSPCTVQTMLGKLAPGDTGWLQSGRYQGAASMLNLRSFVPNKSGTSVAPITVKSVVDGGAWIDGQNTRQTFLDQANSWWIFEGFDISDSTGTVFGFAQGSNNVIRRRICAWNSTILTATSNEHVWGTMSANGLMEDVCGFGRGRNVYVDFESQAANNTVRRAYFIWDGWCPGCGALQPGPAIQTSYGTPANSLYENIITVHRAHQYGSEAMGPLAPTSGTTEGAWHFRDAPPSGSPGYRLRGVIGYGINNPPLKINFTWLNHQEKPFSAVDLYFDTRIANGHTTQSAPGPEYPNTILFHCKPPQVPCNTSVVDRITTIRGTTASDAKPILFHSSWVRTNQHECTDPASCPNFYTGASTSGSLQGARNCFEYQGGSLTNVPLWPWRMDDRIKQAMQRAGLPALLGSAQTVTSEIQTKFGAIPVECTRDTVTPPPTTPTTATVQYLMNEAASGQGPANLVDVEATPLNLATTYSSQPVYTAPGTGRGLTWATARSTGVSSVPIDGTKFKTQFQGAQKLSIVVATSITDATPPAANLESGIRLCLCPLGNTGMSVIFNGVGVTWSGYDHAAAGRRVWHAVVDTTQASASNRIRLYRDGVDQGTATSGTFPALNAALDLGTGRRLYVGNNDQAAGVAGSIAGSIYSVTYYATALSAAAVATDAGAIATDDDTQRNAIDPTPPPTSVTFVGAGVWQATTTSTTLTPGLVAGGSATDQTLALVATRTTGSMPTVSVPAGGWTRISTGHQSGGRNIGCEVWAKDGNAPTVAPVFAISDIGFGWSIALIQYGNTSGGVAGFPSTAAAVSTVIPGAVETLENNVRIFSFVATADLNQLSLQTPAGWTPRLVGAPWDSNFGPLAIGMADFTQGAPAVVPMPTWQQELNGPDEWCMATVGLGLIQTPVPPTPPDGQPPLPIPRFIITGQPVVAPIYVPAQP